MGIVLLIIGLLGVFIGALIYSNKFCNDIYAKESIKDMASLFVFAFCVILIAFIWLIIVAQNDGESYNSVINRKENLEYYLENIDLHQDKFLYEDINEFNERLKEYKDSYSNLWINWFFNGNIASIDYIDLKYDKTRP